MAVRNIRRPAEQHASRANFVAQLLRNILYGEICDVSRYLPPPPPDTPTLTLLYLKSIPFYCPMTAQTCKVKS